MTRNFLFLFLIAFLLIGCDSFQNRNRDISGSSVDKVIEPSVYINDLDKIWMNSKFSEDQITFHADKVEQQLVNYISIFPSFGDEEIQSSLGKLVKRSQSNDVYYSFLKDKFSFYLYHPNSPMRNEFYFEKVLNAYLLSDSISDVDRLRDQNLLKLVKKNQVGTLASNFDYVDVQGVKREMYSSGGELKLIIFYNPICSHCNEVLEEMKNNQTLNKVVDSGIVKVLAIDPVGDYLQWKTYQKNIPSQWINGFDKKLSINNNTLYNIQAYPTLYLLDRDNLVVLKDVYFPEIENFLIKN